MKRIAIIGLLMVFTITNYAYANLTAEELSRAIEKAQRQELTQEEIEGIVIGLLRSIDGELVNREAMNWEEFIEKVEERQDIEPLQEYCTYCIEWVTFFLLLSVINPQYSILLTFHIVIPSCLMCLISFFP